MSFRKMIGISIGVAIVFVGQIALTQSAAQANQETIPQPPQEQIDAYHDPGKKTIVELQQFRTTSAINIQNIAGKRGIATLINLNPHINTWFLLNLQWAGDDGIESYHLENHDPAHQQVLLTPQYPYGLVLSTAEKKTSCDFWSGSSRSALRTIKTSGDVYVPLCGKQLFMRRKTKGHKTSKEWATDFLRNYVPGGEEITAFVREQFYQDAFLNTSQVLAAETPGIMSTDRSTSPGVPPEPLINPDYTEQYLAPDRLGIQVDSEVEGQMLVGRWYRVQDVPGVFVSVIQPKLVAEEVIQRQKGQVNSLDGIEASALVYLVAFDLAQFEVGFAMGTVHPRVDWSDRALGSVRNNALPGPDGIGNVEPLVKTGMVNPIHARRVVAVCSGGFKRYHSAFKYGDFAVSNRGSHYGVLENGVVMSKLIPGLATAIVFDDGTVEVKTWSEQDNAQLYRVYHARQNGVPIIDYDAATGRSKPGAFVKSFANGNWSGSSEGDLRTLRASLGLLEHEGSRFLVYGYFSTATPSAMARVFGAYHCKYAMLLDMNALVHTYMAVYRMQANQFEVQHLIKEMNQLDVKDNQVIPRFVGYADNRDFFYLLRK